jgi:hypothetical protein
MFAPWKVLRVIDLSAGGGLNYNGIETLRRIECVEKYQRGVLPSRTSVKKPPMNSIKLDKALFLFQRRNLSTVRCFNMISSDFYAFC